MRQNPQQKATRSSVQMEMEEMRQTAFANDQRMNTLDHAMPVRTQPHHAPHTTYIPRRARAHGRQCLHARSPAPHHRHQPNNAHTAHPVCAHAMLSHRSP